MENKCFVITSLQPWDIEIGSTIKNTALEISKENRVIYVNSPIDFATWIKGNKAIQSNKRRMEVIRKKVNPIRKIKDNLWVVDSTFIAYSFNFIKNKQIFDFFNKLNNKKIARTILDATKRLGFEDFIHLIDTDIYRSLYLKEMINPAVSIYYCRDYVIGQPYWIPNGARLEPLIAAKADIVLTNSTQFLQRFKQYNKNSHVIETGVNLELYDAKKTWNVPEDIASIPRPIIGYIGTLLESRIDTQLLIEVANMCPNYSFVFVGPEIEGFEKTPLHSLKNTYFLGAKQVNQLPSYIQSFDVCINPQILNPITDGNYPLKIDEYLAIGKPVVATSTHTMRDIFSAYSFLFTDAKSFVVCIKNALSEVGDEHRKNEKIAFAHTHSWGHSVKKIYNAIDDFISREK